MISRFRLKFGRAAGREAEFVTATPITVFVGPNNSGKSKVLSEIEQLCRSGRIDANAVILGELEFAALTEEEAAEAVNHLQVRPNPGEAVQPDHIIIGARNNRMQLHRDRLLQVVRSPVADLTRFCQWFLTHSTLMLDGKSRIALVNPQSAGDLHQEPQTSFQSLFRNDVKRQEVRRIVYEGFNQYFVLDPTNLGQLRARLSARAPTDPLEERGIHAEAVQFHADAQLIDYASDGVKAFTGIITEVIAGDPRVLLIDEPEAFLHPSLAFKLGSELARAALSTNKRIFASTHSASFVMGCIQSGTPVNIVRLTYRSGVATARILPSGDLLRLMRNPLLRSTNVVSGLFYEFVVITESDTDRAFYQEVNERLLRFSPELGIPNALFINSQNKQTIHTLMRPLRQLGIPTAAIVDIDVIKDGGAAWGNLVSGANVPDIAQGALATLRAAVKQSIEASGRDMNRDGGLSTLQGGEREAAENLLNQLAEYGVFAVPGGELESWVRGLGATGHGPFWLISVFERMGEDPDHEGYVKPSNDDVWAFLASVKGWLTNPHRKGIPI